MNLVSQHAAPGDPDRAPGSVSSQQIEAARYVVLRRLSPALRHDMVRPLQPIALISSVMIPMLDHPTPDIEALRQQVNEIDGLAKAALTGFLDIGTWLDPEPGRLVEFGAGVSECVGLMATSLHFFGFNLVNDVATPPVSVDRDAMRMVLLAAMLEMTDSLTVPAHLQLSACLGQSEAQLLLRFAAQVGRHLESRDPPYRKVTWDDVQALAAAAEVRLSRQHDGVAMHFAVHAADGPVQGAA